MCWAVCLPCPLWQAIESERALNDLGKKAMWIICLINSGVCFVGLFITTYGIVNISTQNASLKYTDSYTGANGYK